MKTIEAFNNSVSVFTETFRCMQLSKIPNTDIEQLKIQWAQSILKRLRVNLSVAGDVCNNRSVLFVGNHIGYLDIPLLMASAPQISFVAKNELNYWPVFGGAARKAQTVFVKRNNGDSRKSARFAVTEALKQDKRVVIFPSGTTCVNESKIWRKGAFEIAHQSGTPIQPFRINYSPLRAVAYIDKDFFPVHLYKLFGVDQIQATLEFHKPVLVKNPAVDCLHWQQWSKGLIDVQNN